MHFFAFALKKSYWLPPMYSIIFHFGCSLYRQQQVRLCWNRAYVKVSLFDSVLPFGFSFSCLQPLTEDHPYVSLLSPTPNTLPVSTKSCCSQRGLAPRHTHTLTNTTFHHTHTTQTYSHKHSVLRFPANTILVWENLGQIFSPCKLILKW